MENSKCVTYLVNTIINNYKFAIIFFNTFLSEHYSLHFLSSFFLVSTSLFNFFSQTHYQLLSETSRPT